MECTASHRTVPVIFRSNTRTAFWILVLPFIDTLNISNSVWRAHKCEILNAAFISVLLMFTNFVFQLLSSSKRYSNPKKPDKSQLLFQAIVHFSLLFSPFAEFFAGMLGCKLHACELESITELVNCWQVSESDTPVLKLHFFCRSTFEECLVFPSQLPAYLSQMYLLPAMTGRKEGVKSSSSSIGLPLPQGHASRHIFSSQQDQNRTIGDAQVSLVQVNVVLNLEVYQQWNTHGDVSANSASSQTWQHADIQSRNCSCLILSMDRVSSIYLMKSMCSSQFCETNEERTFCY